MQDTPGEPNRGPIGGDAADRQEDDRHERSSFGKSIDLDEQTLALALHCVTDKVPPPGLLRALAGRNV